MRHSGACESVRGLGRHDHVCVPYVDDAALRVAINGYLSDGRRLGQRLLYVGSSAEEELRGHLSDFPDAPRLFADGVIAVASLAGIHERGKPLDAEARLELYARATEEALKEGFTGLRVVAEMTGLVAEPAAWEPHLRWEALADRYMAEMPLSAMCCYDRRELPKPVLADLARVHPAVCDGGDVTSFRVYAGVDRGSLMLGGEVDYFNADDLDRLLELAVPADGRTTLDLGELGFIDQHGLARIARRVASSGAGALRVRNASPGTRRVAELIGVAV